MKNLINTYYQNHSLVYKILLFIVITVTIVYLFPKGGQFKYNIQKGKPWPYENLYAPFDFAILKSEEDIRKEREEIEANKQVRYLTVSVKPWPVLKPPASVLVTVTLTLGSVSKSSDWPAFSFSWPPTTSNRASSTV